LVKLHGKLRLYPALLDLGKQRIPSEEESKGFVRHRAFNRLTENELLKLRTAVIFLIDLLLSEAFLSEIGWILDHSQQLF